MKHRLLSDWLPALLLSLGAMQIASAQVPSAIAEKIKTDGRTINMTVGRLYTPLHQKEPYGGIKITRDVKYGPDERNLLDIFIPEAISKELRPVVVFVHGGGFTSGNRREGNGPFYDNIMLWAVKNNMVGVNVTYRLAPQHQWPAGTEDIAAAVNWVRENIKKQGGDPGRIYVVGHSAGAVHVAGYVAHPELYRIAGAKLAGAIFLSGLYEITADNASPIEHTYFGKDSSLYAARSSLAGLVKSDILLLVTHAEFDPDVFQQQANALKDALCKAGRCPVFAKFAAHNHLSEAFSVNTEDISVSRVMLDFIRNAGKNQSAGNRP